MLIVSKGHDYYDTAHDGFIDKTIVYQRTPVQVNDSLKERLSVFTTGIKGNTIDIEIPYVDSHLRVHDYYENKDLFMVGFCGKFYIGLHHVVNFYYKEDSNIDRYIYDKDEIISCLELKPDKKPNKPSRSWKWYWGNGYTNFIDFWNKYNGVEHPELFLMYRVPIIYIGTDRRVVIDPNGNKRKIVLNPILKDIEFYKTGIDAKTAFMAVQTYISNILTNPEKEPEIPNKVKIESHGFDYKTSFRKDPTKPWKKRK